MRETIKRFSVWFLLAAMLLGLMSGCFSEPDVSTGETTDADTNTDPQYLDLKDMLRGKVADYQIVRSEGMKGAETKMVLSFRQTVAKTADADVKVVTDFELSYPRRDKEIVIGKTELEGKYYTLPEASKTPEEGAYAIDIIGSRVILSYADDVGLKDGLEFLLLAIAGGEPEEVKNTFADTLNENGIPRYADFSLNNYFMDGMKLASSSDLLCFGTAGAGKTVSACLYV